MTCRNAIRCAVSAVSLTIWSLTAHAATPVMLDGWRYIAGPNDLHVFVCERADCVPGSRVVCRVAPPDSALPPGILRKDDAAAARLAGEPPKTATSSGLGLDLRGRTLLFATDGTKMYQATSIVHDATSEFVLTSSSSDEKASQANLDRFETALQATSK